MPRNWTNRPFDGTLEEAVVFVAHWGFCDPHMQEPNIPPLFQTMPKAESPLSFLETKHPPGPFPISPRLSEMGRCQ